MNYILSRTSISILGRLARERIMCAFDFDGTLSPIVEHPDRARMRASTRMLLQRLVSLYPCVVISGRSRADLLDKLRGVSVAGVFGNHGAEIADTQKQGRHLKQWKIALEAEVGTLPGVWIEDKGASLTVHYRQSAQRADSRRRIFAAAAKLKQARAFGGKAVVNIVLDGAPNKGDAVAAARSRLRSNWILYVGDDETDEDAFALKGNLISVRVGRKKQSRARYYLRNQAEIDVLLRQMVRLRAAHRISDSERSAIPRFRAARGQVDRDRG